MPALHAERLCDMQLSDAASYSKHFSIVALGVAHRLHEAVAMHNEVLRSCHCQQRPYDSQLHRIRAVLPTLAHHLHHLHEPNAPDCNRLRSQEF